MEFTQKKKILFKDIGNCFLGTLATHDENSVTARTMSIIVLDEHFYFQTDVNSNKYRQISTNGVCAISYEKYQILGKCEILSHPLLKSNETIFHAFKNAFPGAAQKYSGLEQETLIKVTPTEIKLWEYDKNGAHIEILDFVNELYICKELGY